MFKKYDKNLIGRDFIVGDIHGCFSDLEEKLLSVQFNREADRLFSVGDLTDRGPESALAMGFLKEPWFHPVMGNHEDMMLQVYRGVEPAHWHYQNGGEWTKFESVGWLNKYLDLIKELPLIIQVGNVGILHSLPPLHLTWEDLIKEPARYKQTILWDRDYGNFADKTVEGIGLIYAGHSIVLDPPVKLRTNLLDIDGGAFLKHWHDYKETGELFIEEIRDVV